MPVYLGTNNDDLLVGSSFDDVMGGYDGNDLLDGGPSGADEMIGGRGSDRYFIRDARASVVEYAGEGYDTVETTLPRYTLSANVERIIYVGSSDFVGVGNALDNYIDGGSGNDSLAGLGGNDALRAGAGDDFLDGGEGLDTMIGGTGNDRYYVDATGDSVLENAGEGTDRVTVTQSVRTYTLPGNIEELVNSGSQRFDGYGNAMANLIVGGSGEDWLFGNDGADTLVGREGDDRFYGGADVANTLIGGGGNDTYVIENRGDSIVEFAGEGTDRVITSLTSYTLRTHVENLFYQGNESFSGTGNAAINLIVGGSGSDFLDGKGGEDMLYGGLGNDNYYVYGGETIVEGADAGTDTMRIVGNGFAFTIFSQVENAYSSAYFPVTITGNALDNVIVGTKAETFMVTPSGATISNGGNTLSGGGGGDTIVGGDSTDTLRGGDGIDYLTGGAGSDRFEFFAGETGFDRILDFASGVDRIVLQGFARTGMLALQQGSGSQSATSADSTFLYDRSTGNLSYDADGAGSEQAVLIARLSTNLTLAAGDFVVSSPGTSSGRTVRITEGPYTAPADVADIYSDAYFPVFITGNALDNVIVGTKAETFYYNRGADAMMSNGGNTLSGGAGYDTLIGGGSTDTLRGGDGFDTLTGGAKSDRFDFFSGESGFDVVRDFESGVDKIALSGFARTPTFTLRQGSGAQAATTAESTFLYDRSTGNLSYDPDGTGSAPAVLFARLSTDLTLTTADFLFFTP